MQDQFGRTHDYLRITLNGKEQIPCLLPEENMQSGSEDVVPLSPEEIFSIAKIFVSLGVDKIRLIGEEPLERPDLDKILEMLSVLPVSLRLTTNGEYLNDYFDLFQRVGLEKININLDSMNPAKYSGVAEKQRFFRVVFNIRKAVEKGFKVKLNISAGEDLTGRGLVDFVELTRENNIDIRFIDLFPGFESLNNHQPLIGINELYAEIRKRYFLKKAKESRNDRSMNFRIGGYAGKIGFISPVNNPWCTNCNRLRLSADGKMKNCFFSDEEVDLLAELHSGKDLQKVIQDQLLKKEFSYGGKLQLNY